MKKFDQPKKKETEGPQSSAQLSSSTHLVDRKTRHSSVPSWCYREQTNLYRGCPKASQWATLVVNVLSHQASGWPVIQQWWPQQEHKGRLQNGNESAWEIRISFQWFDKVTLNIMTWLGHRPLVYFIRWWWPSREENILPSSFCFKLGIWRWKHEQYLFGAPILLESIWK